MCRKDKIEQSSKRRRLSRDIFQTIMCTICFTQVLYTAVILNIAIGIKTDVDHGNCKNASSDQLLPFSNVEPLRYTLFLDLVMKSGKYVGESDIVIKVHKPIVRISLHCFGLNIYIKKTSLRSISGVSYQIENYVPFAYRFCTETQIFDIFFDEIISPGIYNLHMYFNNMYKKHENIIRYQYIYTKAEVTNRWFLGILSTSNRARTVFPCWDEPKIHMTYEIIVGHPKRYKVISNMPVKKLLHKSDDTILTYFHPTKPIASSQVAIIMLENKIEYILNQESLWYERYPLEDTDILQEIWDIKKHLAIYLNVSHRIMKTDHIVIPNLPSQVIGRFGVITYREQNVRYDNSIDFPGRKVNIYKMVGDALAREILAEVICPSCFWLIKTFASFLSHFVIFQNNSYSSFMDLSIVRTMQGALYYDVDFQMAPVSQNLFLSPIDEIGEIDAIHYSRLYYNKGAALIRMLLYSLEEPEYFYQGISKCVEKCENTSTTVKGLRTIVSSVLTKNEELHYNITDIMYTWITQRHFPEVQVYRNYSNDYATLSAYNCNEIKRKIPIIYTTLSDFTYMYGESKIILFDCSNKVYVRELDVFDIIIVNIKQIGYYRVNYDSQTWQRIIELLNYNNFAVIDVVNRAQLIDDAYYFVINDKLNTSVLLSLIRYLKREWNYIAWYPMFNILMYMSKYFELPQKINFKSNVFEILDALLKNVGYQEHTKEDDMTKSLRLLGLKWACKLGYISCKIAATSKLILSLENSSSILPWWKEWVYCTGMMEADEKFWHRFLHLVTYTQDDLEYMACTEDEYALTLYLDVLWKLKYGELMVSNRVCTDSEKSYEIIMAAYRSFVKKHARKNAVLMHILDNYDNLTSTILGSKSPVTVLGVTIMELYTKDNFKVVTAFVQSNQYLTKEEKSKIKIFVKQRKIQLEKISYYFRMF